MSEGFWTWFTRVHKEHTATVLDKRDFSSVFEMYRKGLWFWRE